VKSGSAESRAIPWDLKRAATQNDDRIFRYAPGEEAGIRPGTELFVKEDTIREVALPMGLVDIKVCAVDDTWSGLKLVIRKERRK
jgi:hypothetical protein